MKNQNYIFFCAAFQQVPQRKTKRPLSNYYVHIRSVRACVILNYDSVKYNRASTSPITYYWTFSEKKRKKEWDDISTPRCIWSYYYAWCIILHNMYKTDVSFFLLFIQGFLINDITIFQNLHNNWKIILIVFPRQNRSPPPQKKKLDQTAKSKISFGNDIILARTVWFIFTHAMLSFPVSLVTFANVASRKLCWASIRRLALLANGHLRHYYIQPTRKVCWLDFPLAAASGHARQNAVHYSALQVYTDCVSSISILYLIYVYNILRGEFPVRSYEAWIWANISREFVIQWQPPTAIKWIFGQVNTINILYERKNLKIKKKKKKKRKNCDKYYKRSNKG